MGLPSDLPEIASQFGVPGGFELIILLIIVAIVLLLGPKKIPELARGIGKALGEFRRGRAEVERELKRELAETPPPPRAETVVEISPRIVEAAKRLGIEVLGRKERDLKRAIIGALDKATKSKLEAVARALEIKSEGLDADQLKDSISEALGI